MSVLRREAETGWIIGEARFSRGLIERRAKSGAGPNVLPLMLHARDRGQDSPCRGVCWVEFIIEPFSGTPLITADAAEAGRGVGRSTETDFVSADYLQTMGVKLLQGRWLREDDVTNHRKNVVRLNLYSTLTA